MSDVLSKTLADMVQRSFGGGGEWHAPLMKMVEHLSTDQALWRPAPERKCIWEIVRHLNFWREHLLARVKGRPVPDWRAHNWTLPERTDDEAWRDELAKLRAVNDELVAWLKERPAAELLAADEQGEPGELTWVLGIMLHDSYHVGQIATLRALMGLPSVEG